MYKRRGRILFLDHAGGELARLAAAWTSHLGSQWVETGAAVLGTRHAPSRVWAAVDLPGPEPEVVDWQAVDVRDWDLVVPLQVAGQPDWSVPLAGVRYKEWQLGEECLIPADPDPAWAEGCGRALRRRAEGLLGGFRMKAREDDAPEG